MFLLTFLPELPFSRRTVKLADDDRDWLTGAGAPPRLVEAPVDNAGFKRLRMFGRDDTTPARSLDSTRVGFLFFTQMWTRHTSDDRVYFFLIIR